MNPLRILLVAGLFALVIAPLVADDKKDELKLSEDEQAVVDLTNAARTKADKNLTPLKPNPKLMEAARKHAENMAAQGKLDHTLDGKTFVDRAKAVEYKYRALGENIAASYKTPKEVVDVWMGSAIHRGNILNKDYAEIGVGVVKNKQGEPYWVQVFGKQ